MKMNHLKNDKTALTPLNISNNITKDEQMEYKAKSYKEYLERMKQYRKKQQKKINY